MTKTRFRKARFNSMKDAARAHARAADHIKKKYPNDIKMQAKELHEFSEKYHDTKLKRDKYGFPMLPKDTQDAIADAGLAVGGATFAAGAFSGNPVALLLGLGDIALVERYKHRKKRKG